MAGVFLLSGTNRHTPLRLPIIVRHQNDANSGHKSPMFDEERPLMLLKDREVDVLRCITRGLTCREAALELGISLRSVERCRENLRNKFHARNGVELITKSASQMESSMKE
jgi:DNA-binding NarL/FixJ family response regulator